MEQALSQLLAQLQADVDALKNQVQVTVTTSDPAWDAVKAALVANGWTAPTAEPAPEAETPDETATETTEEGAQ